MFSGCTNLISIDLKNFDTSSITTMKNMFHSCSKLISLYLSNFKTSSKTDKSGMFSGCNKNMKYCNKSSNVLLNHIKKTSNYNFKNNNNCNDICFNNNKKIILDSKKCSSKCTDSSKYEYKNICYSSCLYGTHKKADSNICINNNNQNSITTSSNIKNDLVIDNLSNQYDYYYYINNKYNCT